MQGQILTLLRRYATAGWRHRWKALILAWLICGVGWVGVYSLPDRYEARARLYADADAVLSQLLRGITIDSSPNSQVDLLQRTILSRPNLERVIARTDLDLRIDTVEAREGVLTRLATDIRFAAQSRNLFTITYTDHDPKLARDVVQTVLNLFIEQASNNDRQQMESARVFLNQQIASYEVQLREAEQRRADFRARYAELLPDGGGVTGLDGARGRVRQLQGELADMNQRRGLLRQQLEATPSTLAPGEIPGSGPAGEGALGEAVRQRAELLVTRTENHPDVRALDARIAALRAGGGIAPPAQPAARPRPASGAASRANPLHEQIRLRMLDVEGEIGSHQRRIREAEADMVRLEAMSRTAPQVQADFQNLDRDYTIIRRNYEELLGRREALQIAGAARNNAERVRLEVVDPPVVPTLPSGPNRILFSSMVLAAGLGAGGALALLLAQFDSSFYSLRDLRSLGLPVLGSISVTVAPKRNLVGSAVFAGGVLLLIGVYGAVLTRGPELLAKVPSLVARMMT